MDFLNYQNIKPILEAAGAWLVDHGLTILLILVAAWVAHKFAHRILTKFIRRLVDGQDYPTADAERRTEDTLIAVFHGTISVILWVLVALMVLSEIGINVGPLLAGAGIAGVAVGFGAQYLVRDLISGLFILMEQQYRVDDVVCISDKCGVVEDISLRATVLRDIDGSVHHIPNGAVDITSNLSKEFSYIKLDMGVSYEAGIEHVEEVVNRVGQELAQDEEWGQYIDEPPGFNRIEEFGDSAIVVRVMGTTKTPLQKWAITGELRKRLKAAFDKEGISIPFPQRVIHQAGD